MPRDRSGAEATPPPDLAAARVRAAFAQVPLAAAVSVANALLMTAALMLLAGDGATWAWLGAVGGVAAGRLLLLRAYRRAGPGQAGERRWAMASMVGAAAAGLLWSLGAILLPPATEPVRLLWVFLIGGMCAGATALHFAHLPTLLAFLLTACLPVAAAFAADGTAAGGVAAAMIVVFAAALVATACRLSRAFEEQLRLQAALAAARRRLDAEIAEHRITEATLRHAQKMEAVGQLTAGIAHDFGNLLTAVLGSLAGLRGRLAPGDATAARLLEAALQGAERGAALTRRLLAFGRRRTARDDVVALDTLVGGMAELLRGTLGAGVALDLDLPAGLPAVRVDPDALELALLNLAANARDAMPGGGRVRVSAVPETAGEGAKAGGVAAAGAMPGVALIVADTGDGMAPAVLARATEAFFTTKPAGVGTGLGLSMVHGLAARSGGRLVLRSVPGVGTEARLWLPAATTDVVPLAGEIAAAPLAGPLPAAASPAAAASGGRRVLVADADGASRAATGLLLGGLGHRVVEAATGARALAMLRADPGIDLLLADVALPDLGGVALAIAAAGLRPGLPVILTGVPGQLPPTPALPWLAKPLDGAATARQLAHSMAE